MTRTGESGWAWRSYLSALGAALVCLGLAVERGDERWSLLCDFDGVVRQWTMEHGPGPEVAVTDQAAHSGKRSLAVRFLRIRADCLRQTWGADVSDLRWSPDSRVRFRIKGSPRARNPHGGLLFIEAGGRRGGGDSHWLAPIAGEAYSETEWRQVTTVSLREAGNPDWAPDADGWPDPSRIVRLLFVAQQEAPPEESLPYTIYLDDVEASAVEPLPVRYSDAGVEAQPDHVTPIWRGFKGRRREHPAQVTFADVSGWRVAQHGGAIATLLRSEEEPCYEDLRYQAKLTYFSRDGSGWFELLPPRPLALPATWNAVCVWVYGNNWDWVPDPATPQVELILRVIDTTGQRHRLNLGRVNFRFYGLLSKRLHVRPEGDPNHVFGGGARDGRIHHPARLEAIEVRRGVQPEPRTVYLESVAFYQDDMPLPPFRPELLADLPFPTTPDTILPTVTQPTRVSLRRQSGAFVFTARGDETVVWRYEPWTGTLSDLTVQVAGRAPFEPCRDGGPVLLLAGRERYPGDVEVQRELVQVNREGDVVTAVWRASCGGEAARYTLKLRARGKSMVVDWSAAEPVATALQLGRAAPLADYRLIRVPYLNIQSAGPAVLLAGDTFALTLLDWYNTDSSAFFAEYGAVEEGARMNGGSAYYQLTDGTRNPLRERQFINVSSRFEEVLPNIPNPPSTQAAVTRENLYCHLGGIVVNRFDLWLQMWRQYHRKGIEHLLITHHEDAWSDGADVGQGPQEYTICIEAAPEIGDARLIEYCRQVRRLGYWVGLYENFTDYNPLGRSWDERNCARSSAGERWRVWPPTYAIRPYKALEMALDYPRRVARKFGTNTAYRDCHTAYPPWGQVDFQAGSPEAGKFSQCFRAWGALLRDGHRAYGGPIFSEGLHHWFSAGLVDGNYAQTGIPEGEKYPLLLDFDLLKLHPLEADIAMSPHWAWGSAGEWGGLAATIAYGHIGFQPFGDLAFAARYYYLMQQLQSRYVMVPVESIRYHREGRLYDTSEALKTGAHEARQVLVRYQNGLEVAVNFDPVVPWLVEVGGQPYDLRGYSWAAAAPDGFVEYCTELEGRRIGYVDSPVYRFADGGGRLHGFGAVATDGALALRKDQPGGLKLIPLAQVTTVALAAPADTPIEAYDARHRLLGPVPTRVEGGHLAWGVEPGVDYYRVWEP